MLAKSFASCSNVRAAESNFDFSVDHGQTGSTPRGRLTALPDQHVWRIADAGDEGNW
jgi:hypothetical protein